ncbi:MAG TPA: TIR domain-containing protein [Polyangiaceae bacterium]|nr:TIR domain-containing protein [Polyangiaceae bacterium]
MSAVFISHASQDRAQAEELKRALAVAGFGSVFLDFDEKQGIAGGADWEKTLHVRLRGCRVLIALNSHAFRKSTWCHSEVTVAKTLSKVVLPALIDDSEPHEVLRHIQAFNLRDAGDAAKAKGYSGLVAALEKEGLVKGAWDPKTSGSPYPGLEAFDEQHAEVFFGRDAATRDCLEKLLGLSERPDAGKSWLVLYGASGSGKSSLMGAGVIPAFRRTSCGLVVGPVRPGRQPTTSLAHALRDAFRRYAPGAAEPSLQELVDLLRNPDQTGLAEGLERLRRAAGKPGELVAVAIDQLEEALSWASPATAATPSARRDSIAAKAPTHVEFARLLRRASAPRSGCVVLATLRADFMGAFHDYPPLRGLEYEDFVVKPITDVRDIRALIEKPAELSNAAFDAGLVDEIVGDVLDNDALPLLAFTLERLWSAGADDGLLTRAEYHATGRIKEAVKTKADLVLAELGLSDPDTDALRSALLQLVRFGDNNQPVRALGVRFSSLPARAHPALEAFVAARLLISSGEGPERQLSVAHEALFRTWPRLTGWIDDQRVLLGWRRKILQRLQDWQAPGADQADQLLRGASLAEALELRKRNEGLLSELELSFIRAGEDAAARELQRARRKRRLANVAGAGTLAVIALGAVLERNAARDARQAEMRAREAQSAAVSAQRAAEQEHLLALEDNARSAYLAGRADKAMLYALRARKAGFTRPTTRTTLALAASVTIDAQLAELHGHRDRVYSSASVRSVLVTGSADGTARLWNVAAPTRPTQLGFVDHGHKVRSVALDRDARWLATGGDDGNVVLWDVADPTKPRRVSRLSPPKNASSVVWSVVFSPDGHRILTGEGNNTARVWDVTSRAQPRLVQTLSAADGRVEVVFRSVAFSPKGQSVAAGSEDGKTRIWDLSGAAAPTRILQTAGEVSGVAFSPDGKHILTTSTSNTAQLWSAQTGELQAELRGHTEELTGGGFSRDSSLIVTSSWDGTARIWSATSGNPLLTLVGHVGFVASAEFLDSPHNEVVTTGEDKTVRLWKSDGPLRTEQPDLAARSASFSRDGERVVAVLGRKPEHESDEPVRNGTAVLLRTSDGSWQELGGANSNSAEFSRDGKYVVTVGDDSSASIYEVAHPDQAPRVLKFGSGPLWAAEFGPDARLLATAGEDSNASLWDMAGPHSPERTPLKGHTGPVHSVAFDPSGQRLLTASLDESVILWDVHDPSAPRLQHRWAGISRGANSARFSPDGEWVVVAGRDGRVRLMKPSHPEDPALELDGDGNLLYDARFSPDGTRLITAGARGSVGLWDVASRTLIALLRRHDWAVLSAGFSFDGRRAVSAGNDGLRLWDVHLEERSPEQLQAMVDCRIPLQWVGEALQPTHPRDLSRCPNQ